jgi:hypothetical protein
LGVRRREWVTCESESDIENNEKRMDILRHTKKRLSLTSAPPWRDPGVEDIRAGSGCPEIVERMGGKASRALSSAKFEPGLSRFCDSMLA